MSQDDVFAEARAADIAALAGVALKRSGSRLRGQCPLCGSGKGARHGGAFSVDPQRGLFICFSCGASGDAISLERALRGGSAREAAERLAGYPVPAAPLRLRVVSAEPAPERRSLADLAWRIWQEAVPCQAGDRASDYLRGRGLSRAMVARAMPALRFHPDLYWGRTDDGRPLHFPAMVAQVVTRTGPTGGVHVTYLDPARGQGKARIDPAKRMIGPQASATGQPGGVVLIAPQTGALIIGEGIESSLSAAQIADAPEGTGVMAALALNRLQGGWAADRYGRVDLAMPKADPARPAFVWPGGDVVRVQICVDHDMRPIRVPVRAAIGGTMQKALTPRERAAVCAALAAQAWRAACPGALVSVHAPPAGQDFNDALRSAEVAA